MVYSCVWQILDWNCEKKDGNTIMDITDAITFAFLMTICYVIASNMSWCRVLHDNVLIIDILTLNRVTYKSYYIHVDYIFHGI